MQASARRRLRAARPAGAPPPAAGAAGAAEPAAAAAEAGQAAPPEPPRVCRICWAEEGDGAAGPLLAPCRCAGSQRWVHVSCLQSWMQAVADNKGAHAARQCEVCRTRYRLPRELRAPAEPPRQRLARHARAFAHSPLGTVASYYAAAGLVYASLSAVAGAGDRLACLHSLVLMSARDPLGALRQVAPDLALTMASEACLSGEWAVPLLSLMRAAQGTGLRFAASLVQAQAREVLPPPLMPLATGACFLVWLAGNALQYTHLGLLLLFGGLARGFARGSLLCVQAPFRLIGGAAGAVCRAAGLAASMLPFRRRRRADGGNQQGRRQGVGVAAARQQQAGRPQEQWRPPQSPFHQFREEVRRAALK